MRFPKLLLAALAVGCASLGGGREVPIRDMTWNIHAGADAHGVPNLDRLAAVIRDSRADVVLLQEVDSVVDRSRDVDQLAVLAAATGMHGAFGRSLDYQGGGYGIAILSRWPITYDTTYRLVVDPPQARAGGSHEPRSALFAELAAPGGTIAVLNTHIDASRADDYRLQEIRGVLAIASSRHRGDRPLLIGGDLNSTPESAVQQLVREAGWSDAWSACGGIAAGFTYPDSASTKRIDYVYFRDGWRRCAGAQVLETNASDHRPVVVDLYRD